MLSQWERFRPRNWSQELFAATFFRDIWENELLYFIFFWGENSFSQVTPFGVLGMVLKRTEMFVFVCWNTTHVLPGFAWPTGCPWA